MQEQSTEPIIIDKLFDLELLVNEIAYEFDKEFYIFDTKPHISEDSIEVLLVYSMGVYNTRVIERPIIKYLNNQPSQKLLKAKVSLINSYIM